MKTILAAVMSTLVGATILAAGLAHAEILAGGTNPNARSHGCGTSTVDLNGILPGTNVRFTLPASREPRPLSVLFNAECSVAAGDDRTWLDIDVELLDRTSGTIVGALPPTSDDNAFCTSTGDGALQHWVSASTNTFTSLPAGPELELAIRVRGTLRGCVAGERWRIDDVSAVVMR